METGYGFGGEREVLSLHLPFHHPQTCNYCCCCRADLRQIIPATRCAIFPYVGVKNVWVWFFFVLGNGLTAGNCTSSVTCRVFFWSNTHPQFSHQQHYRKEGEESKEVNFTQGLALFSFFLLPRFFLWEIELRDAAMKRFCFGTTFEDSFRWLRSGKNALLKLFSHNCQQLAW